MLFIIGVLALAATVAVFALPVVLIALAVNAARLSARGPREAVADGPADADAFEQIIAREWPS